MSDKFITDGKWEELESYSSRLKVPGGWIVKSEKTYRGSAVHQIFIKDENHIWEIE